MMFTMIISLFTSRVILQILGVNDYGIYQTVGGFVAMLSFVNGALSMGSSRFLTYELGTGNKEKLALTFSTTLSIHILLAVIIILIAETVGLWFVCHKLIIPAERLDAAIFTYHLSIITALVSITQVPYNASIISHEHMNVYAYMSIVEVSLKLIIVYMLTISDWDKLKVYSLLLCIVQICIALFYRYYCVKRFAEARYKFILNKEILKNVLGYSGWNLFANASIALSTQGTTVLINMFFNPGVVAARAIANQVNMAANQFVNNFRTAVNPQIVKRYASEDYIGSKRLLLSSTKYSFYLMLTLCLPITLLAPQLLQLWLGQVPEYASYFLRLAIITSLFQVFDVSFYTALYAKGQIKENAMISPVIGFLQFPISYFLFKLGYPPTTLAWVSLVCYVILGIIIKPFLVVKIVNYEWRDIWSIYKPCILVSILAIPIPISVDYFLSTQNNIFHFIGTLICCIFCIAVSVWYLGLDKEIKEKIKFFISRKL